MSNKYKLVTIQDIFLKIPEDKIQQCMEELTVVLQQCKQAQAGMEAFAVSLGHSKSDVECTFPYEVEWVDDGKEEVVTNVIVSDALGNNMPLFTIQQEGGNGE